SSASTGVHRHGYRSSPIRAQISAHGPTPRPAPLTSSEDDHFPLPRPGHLRPRENGRMADLNALRALRTRFAR
ncbi:hypothetical protein NGM37_47245, partial [Streptomyces sp. TRM76130]|nr:hypothetical protein [Streptomyces sp. TRM76130]